MTPRFFQLADKILTRLPRLGGLWPLRDALYCQWVLRAHPGLRAKAAGLRGTAELFAFAAGPPELFPSHQNLPEIAEFIEFAKERGPRTAVEIGTARSGTNFLLGQALPSLEIIIGLDLQPRNLPLLRAFSRKGLRRVMIKGPSASRRVAARVKSALDGRRIDLLFIDGDHTYEGVRADFETYWPLVAGGGIVAFHDIAPDYRTRFGRPTERWAGDVPKFWQEVKAGRKDAREFVEDPGQDGLGIGALVK